MINMLNLFNQENTDIKSGGANVSNYKIEIYKKTYNLFEECDYDNREPFSVNNKNHFNREKKYLEILEKYNISPKIIESNGKTLILSDCGKILNKENTPLNWKQQLRDIHQILKNENIYHNDIKPDNITVKENKIYLIDYGWGSENIPEYPYLNLTSEIIEKSQTIEELFHHIYNKSSELTLKCALNINKYLNENLRNRF